MVGPKAILPEKQANCILVSSMPGSFRLLPQGDSQGSEKHASLENTLVRFKPDTIHDYSTCFMIKMKCANDTIIELHDLHKLFVSKWFLPSCFDGSTAPRMRSRGRGFKSRWHPMKTLAVFFTPPCQYISKDTLKSVRTFYMVSLRVSWRVS